MPFVLGVYRMPLGSCFTFGLQQARGVLARPDRSVVVELCASGHLADGNMVHNSSLYVRMLGMLGSGEMTSTAPGPGRRTKLRLCLSSRILFCHRHLHLHLQLHPTTVPAAPLFRYQASNILPFVC